MATGQGYFTIRVGETRVTSLNDGSLKLTHDEIKGILPEEIDAVMSRYFLESPPRIMVNCFCIETSDTTGLIDAGAGLSLGPDMGRLQSSLAAAGISPESIDFVFLTHMHIDHAYGLLTTTGEPLFPNARIFVHPDELAFWRDKSNIEQLSDVMKMDFPLIDSVLTAYDGKFADCRAQSHLSCLSPIDLPGHSPGHVGYLIESEGEYLFIWGDTVHIPELQISNPTITMAFDFDPQQARSSRKRALEMAARQGWVVAGMHLNYPGFAWITQQEEGFSLVPRRWSPSEA